MGQSIDEVRQLLRQGKLVPIGSEREAFVARADHDGDLQPGDVLPGALIVTAVQDTTESGWKLKVKRLVPPRWSRS